jgi:hypothetical protein
MKSLTQAKRASVKPLVIGLLTAIGAICTAEAAQAGEFRSTLTEVAVFNDRVHCRCKTTTVDGSETIYFFAVPTADAKLADRLLTIGTTAVVSGRRFIAGFTNGDTSGANFGCKGACRKLTYFGLESGSP